MSDDMSGRAALIDVSGLSLDELRNLHNPALVRVLEVLGDSADSVASFNSAM